MAIRSLVAMEACRPYLRVMEVFNMDSFRTTDTRVIGLNIFYIFWVVFQNVTLVGTALAGLWLCIELKFTIEDTSETIPGVVGLLQMSFVSVSLVWNNRVITATMDRLQSLVDEYIQYSEESFAIYQAREKSHAYVTSWLFGVPMGFCVLMYVPTAMIPIWYACFGHPDPETWAIPFKMHTLIGRTSYVGFYLDWGFDTMSSIAYGVILTTSGSLFMGVSYYINCMAQDVRVRLRDIDEELKDTEKCDRREMGRLWSKYIDVIRLHNNIIELADRIDGMMSGVLFYQLLMCTAIIAFDLFGLEETGASSGAEITFYTMASGLVQSYLYCKLSENITTDLSDLGDTFYDTLWYLWPTDKQYLVMMPIERTQKEFRLKGFEFVECSLRIFSTIIRTSSSYFLMIRSLGN